MSTPEFDQWFDNFWKPAPLNEEELLPEGITETRDGEYEAQCCMCHRWTPLYCDISEVPAEGYEHYCGGSPMCCP